MLLTSYLQYGPQSRIFLSKAGKSKQAGKKNEQIKRTRYFVPVLVHLY